MDGIDPRGSSGRGPNLVPDFTGSSIVKSVVIAQPSNDRLGHAVTTARALPCGGRRRRDEPQVPARPSSPPALCRPVHGYVMQPGSPSPSTGLRARWWSRTTPAGTTCPAERRRRPTPEATLRRECYENQLVLEDWRPVGYQLVSEDTAYVQCRRSMSALPRRQPVVTPPRHHGMGCAHLQPGTRPVPRGPGSRVTC